LTLTCCVAASSVATEPKNSQTEPPADAKQQVLDLEREWVAAEVKHDATTLGQILDDKFIASFGVKEPYDKETFIKHIVTGDADPTESQTLTNETVIIDQDTAVVVGTDTVRGTDSGKAYAAVHREWLFSQLSVWCWSPSLQESNRSRKPLLWSPKAGS
jgi:cobalamin biosynthesis protein CobT